MFGEEQLSAPNYHFYIIVFALLGTKVYYVDTSVSAVIALFLSGFVVRLKHINNVRESLGGEAFSSPPSPKTKVVAHTARSAAGGVYYTELSIL